MLRRIASHALSTPITMRVSLMKMLRVFLISYLIILLFSPSSSIASGVKDNAVNRVVAGIISFTYWPGLKTLPQLCLLPGSHHYSITPPAAGDAYHVVSLDSGAELQTRHCDAVYFGEQPAQEQVILLEKVRNRPVLAISENNPDCTIGASFCLILKKEGVSFSVNIDSLARSGVRVNPEVLLLSRKGIK